LKILSGTVRGRRYQPLSVGCSVRDREPPDWFTRASMALEIISKRHPFKGTFGFEMYLIP